MKLGNNLFKSQEQTARFVSPERIQSAIDIYQLREF